MVKRYYGGVISANLPATVGGAFYSTSEAAGEVQKGTWPVSGFWYNQTVATTFQPMGIDIDIDGNIYVCGTETGTQGAGGTEGYLMKYSPSGALLWQRMLGEGVNGQFTSVSVEPSGSTVYVGGGLGTPISPGYSMGVVARFNSAGDLLWQRQQPNGIVTGIKTNTISNSDAAVFSLTYYNATYYFAETRGIDSNGGKNWGRSSTFSIASADFYTSGLDISPTGNIVSVGRCNAQYSSYGNFIHRIGPSNATFEAFEFQAGSAASNTTAVAMDSSNNSYIANWYVVSTFYNGYLTKIDSAGAVQWVKLIVAGSATLTGASKAVRIADDGNIYVAASESSTDTSRVLFTKVNSSGTVLSQYEILFADGSDIYIHNDCMRVKGQYMYLYVRKNVNNIGVNNATLGTFGNSMILKLPLDLSTMIGTKGPVTITNISSLPSAAGSASKYTSISTTNSGVATAVSTTLTPTISTFSTSTSPLA